MSTPTAVFLSFRLGGADGVSVEARKWEWALRELGFRTRRVAGELIDGLRPDDTWIPSLAITPADGARPEPDALAAAIAGVDLVVVENLCSLPLNPTASSMAADVLGVHDGRVVFHHHDLPWEREHLAHHTDLPPRRPGSLHVTINELARRALASRGIEATLVRNAFDLDPPEGDRDATRAERSFAPNDVVVLQPTRAIPRKEVGLGIRFAEALVAHVPDRTVRYWLTGPAEDGYGDELDRLVERASVPVSQGRAPRAEDAYAAADLVVFPSSWEGFGNPVIEATVADRPVAAGHYPVLEELVELGLRLLSIDDPEAAARHLGSDDAVLAAANRACLLANFNIADLPTRLRDAFTAVGWDAW